MITLTMLQNEKSTKELQMIEDYFGEVIDIKYLNEIPYALGKEDLEFEITIKLKENLNIEFTSIENEFYINSSEYEIWITYNKDEHNFSLCTKRYDFDENDIKNIYNEPYKNKKIVKTAKAVINYIERFI